ncbi:MAG: Glu-tRNA(Gln) amidotransferase subunit GatD [Methanothrix sp.]|jgi:glutamyl-tRNA(Gln) amidotransferase subunit D|nr:Glu-tRNA(Gln) amidotransferase subunit GatD [Methanothrix sp.]OPX80749.1 MAG: Glutamyl-tRNA(Gln) amidotransferase subunit D [Methanosaeta sp. PtaB.Bin087]HOI69946.1 Glu-tRNA(Gln) amidotransferase subunit GatD [Methanothrix sp.]HPY73554.1 Glu-tRNA(Gln) amidotransferase subunit GatD [Methanothrix sp.]HQA63199.1 Glu-tRNA(Gln) amidotransferase subunit GatD [Methanothrix sp.]
MLELGDRIAVTKDGIRREGVLMPSVSGRVVIKMDSGYNAGFDPERATVELVAKGKALKIPPPPPPPRREGLPKVSILSTGGTIASKVDYRTGAVTSQFSAEEIISSIPELLEIANYEGKVIYNILSENMKAEYWQELARAVGSEIEKGADGVIVTHGTDTMTYTAAALSFMIKTPVPIVLVGSQRSSDRPSSDAAMNAISAAAVATSDIAEVTVVMHGTSSDGFCLVHRGTRVRKMHTSRRDAFQSINQHPIARVDYPSRDIVILGEHRRRGEVELEVKDGLEPRCALVKYFPGASPDLFEHYITSGYRGIVLEGTGLGHVASDWVGAIKTASDAGIPVVITSQCLRGRICDRVYDTGRDILAAGGIEGGDILPEVALVKLMWALANTSAVDEAEALMKAPIAGEISPSTPTTV